MDLGADGATSASVAASRESGDGSLEQEDAYGVEAGLSSPESIRAAAAAETDRIAAVVRPVVVVIRRSRLGLSAMAGTSSGLSWKFCEPIAPRLPPFTAETRLSPR